MGEKFLSVVQTGVRKTAEGRPRGPFSRVQVYDSSNFFAWWAMEVAKYLQQLALDMPVSDKVLPFCPNHRHPLHCLTW
jgi:hypothetical protein